MKTLASYMQLGSALREQRDFKLGKIYHCNGCHSYRITAKHEGNLYNVYSYKTLIFSLQVGKNEKGQYDNKIVFFNDWFYSRTTSKLQQYLRVAFRIPRVYENVGKRKPNFKPFRDAIYKDGILLEGRKYQENGNNEIFIN